MIRNYEMCCRRDRRGLVEAEDEEVARHDHPHVAWPLLDRVALQI